ncbi:TssQ family T6SS-associated lipoprotein [Undibacterium sp.]|uniref:TssQ family T6SS-associated lipoprotein n=1 Tax=Undibacterium sp. TaxID=1914977 RepID=UPI0025CF862A|nr:TssQ family T6SS-associated lipoprotein [Undibacterium sp.]
MKYFYFSRLTKSCIFALASLLLIGCDTAPKSTATKTPAKAKESKAATSSSETTAPVSTTANPTSASAAASTVAVSNSAADAQALKDGVLLYNNGDYNGAIKLLGSPAIVASKNKAIKLDALKYSAFSYCVTAKAQLCRQQFDRAFKLDPSFKLSPAEIGHPIWGPEFSRSKTAQTK